MSKIDTYAQEVQAITRLASLYRVAIANPPGADEFNEAIRDLKAALIGDRAARIADLERMLFRSCERVEERGFTIPDPATAAWYRQAKADRQLRSKQVAEAALKKVAGVLTAEEIESLGLRP
jgi:hypothetical protein